MASFRVVDLRQGAVGTDTDTVVEGVRSPEEAARVALGIDLVRSGAKRDLMAKVYWQASTERLSMVRLDRPVANEVTRYLFQFRRRADHLVLDVSRWN